MKMILESLLSPLGYKITSAMGGVEALGLINYREFLPDLVLLDVEMSGKSGFEVSLCLYRLNTIDICCQRQGFGYTSCSPVRCL